MSSTGAPLLRRTPLVPSVSQYVPPPRPGSQAAQALEALLAAGNNNNSIITAAAGAAKVSVGFSPEPPSASSASAAAATARAVFAGFTSLRDEAQMEGSDENGRAAFGPTLPRSGAGAASSSGAMEMGSAASLAQSMAGVPLPPLALARAGSLGVLPAGPQTSLFEPGSSALGARHLSMPGPGPFGSPEPPGGTGLTAAFGAGLRVGGGTGNDAYEERDEVEEGDEGAEDDAGGMDGGFYGAVDEEEEEDDDEVGGGRGSGADGDPSSLDDSPPSSGADSQDAAHGDSGRSNKAVGGTPKHGAGGRPGAGSRKRHASGAVVVGSAQLPVARPGSASRSRGVSVGVSGAPFPPDARGVPSSPGASMMTGEFSNLPAVLLGPILSHLTLTEMMAARGVCREWRDELHRTGALSILDIGAILPGTLQPRPSVVASIRSSLSGRDYSFANCGWMSTGHLLHMLGMTLGARRDAAPPPQAQAASTAGSPSALPGSLGPSLQGGAAVEGGAALVLSGALPSLAHYGIRADTSHGDREVCALRLVSAMSLSGGYADAATEPTPSSSSSSSALAALSAAPLPRARPAHSYLRWYLDELSAGEEATKQDLLRAAGSPGAWWGELDGVWSRVGSTAHALRASLRLSDSQPIPHEAAQATHVASAVGPWLTLREAGLMAVQAEVMASRVVGQWTRHCYWEAHTFDAWEEECRQLRARGREANPRPSHVVEDPPRPPPGLWDALTHSASRGYVEMAMALHLLLWRYREAKRAHDAAVAASEAAAERVRAAAAGRGIDEDEGGVAGASAVDSDIGDEGGEGVDSVDELRRLSGGAVPGAGGSKRARIGGFSSSESIASTVSGGYRADSPQAESARTPGSPAVGAAGFAPPVDRFSPGPTLLASGRDFVTCARMQAAATLYDPITELTTQIRRRCEALEEGWVKDRGASLGLLHDARAPLTRDLREKLRVPDRVRAGLASEAFSDVMAANPTAVHALAAGYSSACADAFFYSHALAAERAQEDVQRKRREGGGKGGASGIGAIGGSGMELDDGAGGSEDRATTMPPCVQRMHSVPEVPLPAPAHRDYMLSRDRPARGVDALTFSDLGTPMPQACASQVTGLDLQCCTALSPSNFSLLLSYTPHLSVLRLGGCSQLQAPVLVSLAPQMRSLRQLDMEYVFTVDDSVLAALGTHCPALTRLQLVGCTSVTDAGIRGLLGGCSGLRVLNLRGCKNVTDDGINHLASHAPRLRELCLAGLTGITADSVARLLVTCRRLTRFKGELWYDGTGAAAHGSLPPPEQADAGQSRRSYRLLSSVRGALRYLRTVLPAGHPLLPAVQARYGELTAGSGGRGGGHARAGAGGAAPVDQGEFSHPDAFGLDPDREDHDLDSGLGPIGLPWPGTHGGEASGGQLSGRRGSDMDVDVADLRPAEEAPTEAAAAAAAAAAAVLPAAMNGLTVRAGQAVPVTATASAAAAPSAASGPALVASSAGAAVVAGAPAGPGSAPAGISPPTPDRGQGVMGGGDHSTYMQTGPPERFGEDYEAMSQLPDTDGQGPYGGAPWNTPSRPSQPGAQHLHPQAAREAPLAGRWAAAQSALAEVDREDDDGDDDDDDGGMGDGAGEGSQEGEDEGHANGGALDLGDVDNDDEL